MKPELFFAAFVATSLGAGAMLPTQEPLEVQAAALVAMSGLKVSCDSAICQEGWTAAYDAAIRDEGECSHVVTGREQLEGCKIFVRAAQEVQSLQAAVDQAR